jgi:hypothetical protein
LSVFCDNSFSAGKFLFFSRSFFLPFMFILTSIYLFLILGNSFFYN